MALSGGNWIWSGSLRYFFYATELVRGDIRRLAAVEATQSMEVVFTVWVN